MSFRDLDSRVSGFLNLCFLFFVTFKYKSHIIGKLMVNYVHLHFLGRKLIYCLQLGKKFSAHFFQENIFEHDDKEETISY